ncbi:hypothetical protein JW935_12040, partial [candidate division KSB1 bacterium]|nr:hypothetical protein [candidate division KSB1 bacterium]
VRYSKYRLNIMQRCVAPIKVPPRYSHITKKLNPSHDCGAKHRFWISCKYLILKIMDQEGRYTSAPDQWLSYTKKPAGAIE